MLMMVIELVSLHISHVALLLPCLTFALPHNISEHGAVSVNNTNYTTIAIL